MFLDATKFLLKLRWAVFQIFTKVSPKFCSLSWLFSPESVLFVQNSVLTVLNRLK